MPMKVPEQYRVTQGPLGSDRSYGNNGAFQLPEGLVVIASDQGGWEHVSVSNPKRLPAWTEMCYVKRLFWDEEDAVMQVHPPASTYVNVHPNCLHLWKPVGQEIPLPPSFMVGPVTGDTDHEGSHL